MPPARQDDGSVVPPRVLPRVASPPRPELPNPVSRHARTMTAPPSKTRPGSTPTDAATGEAPAHPIDSISRTAALRRGLDIPEAPEDAEGAPRQGEGPDAGRAR